MPHKCTECSYTISDGSDEIFNGCSECGNDTFAFAPQGHTEEEQEHEEEAPPVESAEKQNENGAQQNARSDFVSEDELPSESETEETQNVETETVRQELNRQFETIRILSPGEYKLNLMKLYENEDRVISLREDGKYAIHIND